MRVSDPNDPRPEPAKDAGYEPPAITWQEELPQGAGLFAGCDKIAGTGEPCNTYPSS